jgi:hypothetical protein
LLLSAIPAAAQLQVGDATKLSLDGTLFTGYDDGWSNTSTSAHSLDVGGNVGLSGSYFNPQFLSFFANNDYGRGQADSDYQSITNSEKFGVGAGIFGGSHFPGSISWTKGYNSTGAVASELSGLTSTGDYGLLSINWGAYVPGLPSLFANYSDSSSSTSIFGTEGETSSKQHNFNLGSAYKIRLGDWKVNLDGRYTRNWGVTGTPQFLNGQEQPTEESTSGSSEQIRAGTEHSFPLNGSFSASAGRTMYDYNFGSGQDSGASDTANALLIVRPTRKLTVAFDAAYSDNAFGSLSQDIVSSTDQAENLGTVRTTLFQGSTTYPLWKSLTVGVNFTREDQFFAGQHYGSNQWGLNTNFSPAWGKRLGSITFFGALTDSATQEGNTNLGGSANVAFRREIDGWKVGANYGYQQSVQTILVLYTISSMSYGGNVAHKLFNNISWTAGFGGGHSVLTPQEGSTNHSESYFSSFSWRAYSLTGGYSQGVGESVFTPNGLVAVNPTSSPLISQNALIFFNTKSYNASFGGQPFRNAALSVGYSSSVGGTSASTSAAQDLLVGGQNFYYGTNWLQGSFVYHFRKLSFNAQFIKFTQSAGSPNNTSPATVVSYVFGISRGFHVF